MPDDSIRSLVYPVRPTDHVAISAIIGFAQAGGSAVFLGRDELTVGHQITSFEIGVGADLLASGKRLVVSSVAVDIQPAHDVLTVVVSATGGPETATESYRLEVQSGEAKSFITIISFEAAN